MRQYLVYVSTPPQIAMAKEALNRIKGASSLGSDDTYEIAPRLFGPMILQVNLIDNLEKVSGHLRQNPVDLLIYDERGEGATSAVTAMRRLKKDVTALADLWGPDFLFPMSRAVVVTSESSSVEHRAFELGRLNIRDVCIAPRSLSALLLWLKDILSHGTAREEKIGIALGGGGIEGFLYQLGVLYALDQASDGPKKLRNCDVISGVSSGSIAGTLFASDLPIAEIIKSLQKRSEVLPPLTSNTIFDLASTEMSKRLFKQSLTRDSLNPRKLLSRTLKTIPTGFFKGDRLEKFFRDALEAVGQEDSFSSFKSKVLIGATDQDTFEHVVLGSGKWKNVKVSEAVRASCALPPVYLPKKLGGRWFIDGQVTKSCNLELTIEKGCGLLIVINPLKPFSYATPGTTDKEGGLYATIQTIKALVSSRFEGSLKHVTERFPDVDFLVFEPDEECAELMAGSPMRYKIRTKVIRSAYLGTLKRLRERHHVYSSKIAKYGLKLKTQDELKALEATFDQVFGDIESS